MPTTSRRTLLRPFHDSRPRGWVGREPEVLDIPSLHYPFILRRDFWVRTSGIESLHRSPLHGSLLDEDRGRSGDPDSQPHGGPVYPPTCPRSHLTDRAQGRDDCDSARHPG